MGGVSSSEAKSQTEMKSVVEGDLGTSSMEVEEQGSCLFCGPCSPRKKESEVWRVDFEENCKKLKELGYRWADTVRKAGIEKESSRVHSMRDFMDLKYQFSRKLRNKQVPVSAELKELLLTSALLEQTVGQTELCRQSLTYQKLGSVRNKPKVVNGRKVQPMVSALNQNMKSLFLPKKTGLGVDEEIESAIYLFVKFTQLMQKHSQDMNNAICRVKQVFIEHIKQTYGHIRRLTTEQDNQMTQSIVQFISLYTLLVNNYYKVQSLSENDKVRFVFSYDNLKSATSVIIFKSDLFYPLVFKLYEESSVDWHINGELAKIMKLKRMATPQAVQVAPEYCLNQLTVNHFVNKSSLEIELNNIQLSANIECEPFETCIMKLKQIQSAQTPISKLKVIISTADKISGSISRFYMINSIPDKKMVDSDGVLTIFMFIILRAGLTNLKSHLRFIENFCTQEQLLSETGYYSKVAESALKVLFEEGDEDRESWL